jgi:superoxide reductase
MSDLSLHIQHDDWKKEKHVPVIDCPNQVKANENFDVTVTLGKEVNHPNTTEHHIAWVSLYFRPADSKNILVIGNYEFSAHGQSTEGPNKGPAYTHHSVTTTMKTSQAGVLHAVAYCNIHGLWESMKSIELA